MDFEYDERLGDYVCRVGASPWLVRTVEPKEDYTLILAFADGTERTFDCSPLLDRPLFRALSDLKVFMGAQALHGTVDWGNDLDIALEYLYENSVICPTNDTRGADWGDPVDALGCSVSEEYKNLSLKEARLKRLDILDTDTR